MAYSLFLSQKSEILSSQLPRDAKLSQVSAWDHLSLQLEHDLLVTLKRQVIMAEDALRSQQDVSDMLKSMDGSIQRYLEFSKVTRSTRSPLDFAPYQLVAWLADPAQQCSLSRLASVKVALSEALHSHELRLLNCGPSDAPLIDRMWNLHSKPDSSPESADAYSNSEYVDVGLSRADSATQSTLLMASLFVASLRLLDYLLRMLILTRFILQDAMGEYPCFWSR
jgi:hypothetical protein